MSENGNKCPVLGRTERSNRDWWPNQLDVSVLHQNPAIGDPMGAEFDYAEEFETLDLDAVKARHRGGHDDVAGLVAGRLRPLRAAVHPDGLAQRGHLPHQRRPRRRRLRRAALRAAQQLARQRQPRQGAPAALAGQEALRPEDLLGRPDGPGRQLRPGVDGVRNVRVRRRARGRLGARRDQLGERGHVARRRALQRRPGAHEPARRRPDGPDLRESGGAERKPGSPCRCPRHPGDVPPHGHERRGDGRARRRRPHLRQDARRGRCRTRRPRARGRPPRGDGPRLEIELRHGQGRRCDHQRVGGRLDAHPGDVGRKLLRDALPLRVGADQEPCRRVAVGADGSRCGGRRARCPRSVEAAQPGHAHDRPRAADGSGLRADLAALPREPGGVR